MASCRTEAGEEAADEPCAAPPAPLDIPELEPEPEPEPEEDAMPVPQLKVGPDGSIVIDEKSLVRGAVVGREGWEGERDGC